MFSLISRVMEVSQGFHCALSFPHSPFPLNTYPICASLFYWLKTPARYGKAERRRRHFWWENTSQGSCPYHPSPTGRVGLTDSGSDGAASEDYPLLIDSGSVNAAS
eukprot:12536614-Heterocapsa_arctica.AAC.1